LSYHEIWSIIIPSVVGVLGILGGIWVGQHLSDRKEKKKSNEDLKKLQYLLNADFTLINRMNEQSLEKILKLANTVRGFTNIMPEIPDNDKFVEFFASFRFGVHEFTYWDSIMAQGILFKLSEHDLRFITTANKAITNTIKIQSEGFAELAKGLFSLAYGNNNPEIIKTNQIKIILNAHLDSMKRGHNSIKETITDVKNNIQWIDLTVEPIQNYKTSEPKMKIDSKGTYTLE
jgi:hypothetical protein